MSFCQCSIIAILSYKEAKFTKTLSLAASYLLLTRKRDGKWGWDEQDGDTVAAKTVPSWKSGDLHPGLGHALTQTYISQVGNFSLFICMMKKVDRIKFWIICLIRFFFSTFTKWNKPSVELCVWKAKRIRKNIYKQINKKQSLEGGWPCILGCPEQSWFMSLLPTFQPVSVCFHHQKCLSLDNSLNDLSTCKEFGFGSSWGIFIRSITYRLKPILFSVLWRLWPFSQNPIQHTHYTHCMQITPDFFQFLRGKNHCVCCCLPSPPTPHYKMTSSSTSIKNT